MEIKRDSDALVAEQRDDVDGILKPVMGKTVGVVAENHIGKPMMDSLPVSVYLSGPEPSRNS